MFGLGVAAVIGALAIFGTLVGPPAPPPMAPETTEAPVVKEFQSYEKGRRWRNVVIAPKPRQSFRYIFGLRSRPCRIIVTL
jgi:hypothetical protein